MAKDVKITVSGPKVTRFGDLDLGDFFVMPHDDVVYMRIYPTWSQRNSSGDIRNAVCLSSGSSVKFFDFDDEIVKLKGTMEFSYA